MPPRPARTRGPRRLLGQARLRHLLDEALVDAYGESEQRVGLYTMIEDNLATPFATVVLGVKVTVERVKMNDADEIVAVCRQGGKRQAIPVVDLPLPKPPPRGAEWIDVYRYWARGW